MKMTEAVNVDGVIGCNHEFEVLMTLVGGVLGRSSTEGVWQAMYFAAWGIVAL